MNNSGEIIPISSSGSKIAFIRKSVFVGNYQELDLKIKQVKENTCTAAA